jgi:hypothetical protein
MYSWHHFNTIRAVHFLVMCATGRHAEVNEAITMTTISSLELRSKITSEARLELWLEKVTVPKPAADEVVVRIDAAPLNPSDIILLLGPLEPASIQAGGTPTHPTASANIPPQHMPGLKARLDKALPVGNEGAGIVVDAVDVRSIPRSRTNPQFNQHGLPETLAPWQIGYEHFAELGDPDSLPEGHLHR